MKKKLLLRVISITLLFVLALSGCKKTVGTPEDNAVPQTKEDEEEEFEKKRQQKQARETAEKRNRHYRSEAGSEETIPRQRVSSTKATNQRKPRGEASRQSRVR